MPEQAVFNALDALSSRQAAWLRITADGEVITVSPPAAEMLDVPVSCPDAHLQHLIFEPEWRHLRARMAGSGMLNHENVLLWPPEGRLLHAQISTLPTGAGDYFVFIALRHAFEDAVRNMPGCADPFELGHDGMFIADEHRILVANPALSEMLAWPQEDLAGRTWAQVVFQEDDVALGESIRATLRAGTRTERTVCFRMRDRVGYREVSVRLGRMWHRGAWHVLGAVRDVTDSRRGEAALRDYAWRLRELSRQIIAVQEEERRRLARELHDEIGQLLTILRLQLEKLRAGGVRDDNLEGAVQSVTLLTQQVRSMSLDLRPSMLDDLGLVPTLRWYVQRAVAVADLELDLVIDDALPRLPPQVETLYFRIAQEAVTNTLRHAAATRLSVRLALERGVLVLEVADDGRGFDVNEKSASGNSSGLPGMHERAALLGADLRIHSAPREGTKLRLSLALRRTDSRKKHA